MRTGTTQSRLKECLDYDPETGVFTWKIRKSYNTKVGGAAGGKGANRYHSIAVDGVQYATHRLAWLYVHGVWPIDQIDHINGDKLDNRLANLREANNSVNQQNIPIQKNNTSGYTGVSWNKRLNKWIAQIYSNGKNHFLGSFNNPVDANAARVIAKMRFHTPVPTTAPARLKPVSGDAC